MSNKLESIKERWTALKKTIGEKTKDNENLYTFTEELNDALIGNINITISISNLITTLEADLNAFENHVNETFGSNNTNDFIKELIAKLNDRKQELEKLNDTKIKDSINNTLGKITQFPS